MPRRQRYDQVEQADTDNDASVVDTSNNTNGDTLHLVLLDFLHTRFELDVPVSSTVLQLKELGVSSHKVPVSQQRLIYQGRLLEDDMPLNELSLNDNSIIHLFPRPRVVIESDNNNNTSAADEEGTNNNNETGNVPIIRMDASEAERRSEILVLGHSDYVESVNNVKLFSFMLLIISIIELMNVISIYQNPNETSSTQDETDDFFPHTNHTNVPSDPQVQAESVFTTWTNLSWLDLCVAIAGVYVSCLGLRAANENRVNTARRYCMGLVFVSIGWLLYNFLITYRVDEVLANENTSDDALSEALQVMVLPAVVWGMCLFRAWQFQQLLVQAEEDANERLQPDVEAPEVSGSDSRSLLV